MTLCDLADMSHVRKATADTISVNSTTYQSNVSWYLTLW